MALQTNPIAPVQTAVAHGWIGTHDPCRARVEIR
jgi:hypothetical protein